MINIKKINFIFFPIIILLLTGLIIFSVFYFINLNNTRDEIEALEKQVQEMSLDNSVKDQELDDFNVLTDNLNRLMTTVYFGSAVPSSNLGGNEKNFTAFSMYYKDRFYLITAGHCVEYDDIKYTDFKFKSNVRGTWIYPELLFYENDYRNNRDFAIFYHDNVSTGLITDTENTKPRYVLGNIERKINFLKEFNTAVQGESGSPILNSGCRLVGVVIKNNNEYTPIEVIIEKIEELNLETDKK